jgi:hypothetical protein
VELPIIGYTEQDTRQARFDRADQMFHAQERSR